MALICILTSQADRVRKLNGLEDGRILVDCVHVKDRPSELPGVPEECAKLGPGQD